MNATIDFGIDLGTTNSSIAVCRRGEVRVFQTNDLMNVTPSVIYVSKTGRILVGKKAYDTWVADPQNTQAEFKRWMGYSDRLKFPGSGKEFSAEELSAEVLKSLRADAERQTQEKIDAAVITVPAAFGSLQCDATGRAAKLAGFEQAPLLQEPIAAAVAYGASPASRDQRWMVFDLGGGTLDIAIVSTRNDRLTVLEHQGNNRLGGKDIDRIIAQQFLLAELAKSYRLPESGDTTQVGGQRLTRALIRHAEQAKISLATEPQTVVEIFDLGEDLDGKPIEAAITLRRSEVEAAVRPIVDQCLALAQRALEGARVSGADLDRVLLVGGPTQMPLIRSALESTLGAKLDHSLDPMTVVSHGAAIYASTVEKQTQSAALPVSTHSAPSDKSAVPIQLAFERASGSSTSPVAGVIDASSGITEVKIDAAGGFWTSGWIPVADGCFQVDVVLHDTKPVTSFTIAARDRKGNAIAVTPHEFNITYMLPMGAPPLPHTIAIELSTTHGVTTFDPVFKRHTPLPAEVRKTYRADRTLRPSEPKSSLPIKFWEIEVSDDPQEKWWAGCVNLSAQRIKRPVVEGSDIELTVKIDASRKITVDLFIASLNQSFSDDVYIPDPPAARSQLQQQLDLCFERLEHINEELYAADRGDLAPQVAQLQQTAEDIAEQVLVHNDRDDDPDAALEPTAALRQLRLQLTRLEEQLGVTSAAPSITRDLRWRVPYVERIVRNHGTVSEKRQMQQLREQYARYLEAADHRGLRWIQDQVWTLHTNVTYDQMRYWQSKLEQYSAPGYRFVNQAEATKILQEASAAGTQNDLAGLRNAMKRLFQLVPPDVLRAAEERDAASGLRAT
jgi:molecular chaperone DnaK